jgi:hypothetical protein
MPGGPGMPGAPGGGFGAPSAPPAACQELLTLRDETQKRASAINVASEKKASPVEACKLFKAFLAAETRMIKVIEERMQQCGLPPDLPKQVKAGHSKAQQIADRVCEVAAQGDRPAGPSLSDALGVSPTVPEASKKPGGAFDTLTGNALAR